MKSSGHYSAAIKQESLFSIKWDVTTLKLNQFILRKKFLTADNCVRCHVSNRAVDFRGVGVGADSFFLAAG